MSDGITYFKGHCRDCDRAIILATPATEQFRTSNGVHGRCAECGRTEWLDKATDGKLDLDDDTEA